MQKMRYDEVDKKEEKSQVSRKFDSELWNPKQDLVSIQIEFAPVEWFGATVASAVCVYIAIRKSGMQKKENNKVNKAVH